jgi:hypothetical protein
MESEPERQRAMKLRHFPAEMLTIFVDRLIILGGMFALLGAGSVFVAIWLYMVPMPWRVVVYLAYWPYEIMLLLPTNLRSDVFDAFPYLYVFGLPMLGWGLVGIGVALWTAPRDTNLN